MQQITTDAFTSLLLTHCKKENEDTLVFMFSQFGVGGTYQGAEINDVEPMYTKRPVLAKREVGTTTYYTVFQDRPKAGYNGFPLNEYFEIVCAPDKKWYMDFERKKKILDLLPSSRLVQLQPPNRPSKIDVLFEALRDALVS